MAATHPTPASSPKQLWKRCVRCDRDKPVEGFSRRSRSRDGLSSHCRDCKRVENAKRKLESPEKKLARSRASYRERLSRRGYEFGVWRGIINRCENPGQHGYRDYGGRGVRICKRWRESFTAFIEDVGRRPSPGHSLDRIDNDGDYEPGNVRWATRVEQQANTRKSRRLTFNGETLIVAEWSRKTGVAPRTLVRRLAAGWTMRETLTKKPREQQRHLSAKSSWEGMKTRCYNKNYHAYPSYGGRGIKVCERWLHSLANFLADMGPKPSLRHSLDRIDVNGDYCPENCRWATPAEQARNRQRHK